ncbi:MAG: asparagine synthase (glutamine-hydrolyzing) [Burkholderiaceae bacterium]|nr:asparagine synthase (glutamine-hydrolyzing) [Burkholderiaceae bacterium]
MCGIAGFLGAPAGFDLERGARRMAAELVHRGPDDEGVWLDPAYGLALAHRRLAIIDVSPQGHQPMHSVSGRYVVAYNGEIYNFEQIRAELQAAGRAPAWRGHSDTEVLLAAVEAWGFEATLSRMVGMFAIALWDRETCTLNLARDRIGEKPLYYGRTDQGVVFGSELKAIRALCGGMLEVDPQVLSEFMQFGYIPAPSCIYRGLAKLPPGHFVQIVHGATVGDPQPFWRLGAVPQSDLVAQLAGADDAYLIDLLHDRLKASVGLQMVSDVPLGAFLSGGVDSSTVVALMQAQSARRVKTYTIGFHEKAFDEAPYAKAVAQHLGTDHTELYVSAADAAAIIPELPRIYDEPFADSSQIPTTLVSRLTRQHVTVSLSGDGGDELFAGYPRYAITAALWRRISGLPMGLRAAAAAALRCASPQGWDRAFTLLPAARRQSINGRRVHRLAQLLVSRSLAEMYVRLMSQWQPEEELVLGVRGRVTDRLRWSAQGTPIEQMRHWDVDQYLPDDLLVKVDRAAMSASLESRAPLLDHRVVELAFALPERMLVRDGQGKWILRRVLDRYVPRELIERPKAGFAVPLAQWLRGPLRDWAQHLLDPSRLKAMGQLDADKITQLWQQHQSGTFDRSYYLWNVIAFQAWLENTQLHGSVSRP